ncbi:MAG: histidinol-phosphatase [Candidatus Amulumruptor caecigallinarius]|nr:histidinol-phosphatase [Candidatus Amulumruptor caecigallinarius]
MTQSELTSPAQHISGIISATEMCNFHSHTQYCDGHNSIREMVAAARDAGFMAWGITPHSPVCIDSPCNMHASDVSAYLDEMNSIKDEFRGETEVFTSMEIDFLGRDFGPHIDYFQNIPLDYRLGSVHFVPTQDGIPVDCDGSFNRFADNLRRAYAGDLRYVVEKYFEQVLIMLELGGIDMLGHFDKIIGNASQIDSELEEQQWYAALIEDVIIHAATAGVVVEINTKAINDRKRYYPAERWWNQIIRAGLPIAVNSDAHYKEKVNLGRPEALRKISVLRKSGAQ